MAWEVLPLMVVFKDLMATPEKGRTGHLKKDFILFIFFYGTKV
jgi:hypothetical protein